MTEQNGDSATADPTASDVEIVKSSNSDQPPAEEEEVAAQPALNGMVIRPPSQKKGTETDSCGFVLPLPPIRPEEPVQSIRLALAEVVGLAHFTNYRIEVETSNEEEPDTSGETVLPLISPFTGPNAVVSIPSALKSLDEAPTVEASNGEKAKESNVVLDEFGDLQSTAGIQDGSSLRLVLERYDAASVKEHILRLRHIFDGNAPAVTSLLDDTAVPPPEEEGDDTKNGKEKHLPDLPDLPSPRVNGQNLADFFFLSSGENPADFDQPNVASINKSTTNGKSSSKKKKTKATNGKKGVGSDGESPGETGAIAADVVRDNIFRLNQLEGAVHMPCSIQYSGFHPPPSGRRLMGDIAYLEVTIAGEEDGSDIIVSITACNNGFYVNRSTRVGGKRRFDPSPAPKPYFSHTLLDCVLQASPALAGMWSAVLEAAKERSEILAKINKGAFATLFRLAIRGSVGGFADPAIAMKSSVALDATLNAPSWLVSVPAAKDKEGGVWNRNACHGYHTGRAEDDLSQTFGVDVRSGALRDWNEELQLAREMPISTLYERLDRARVIHKTMTEFGEASLVGVKAICDGHIAPMNPNEGTRTQVYLHNNIFVSRALDVGPETFRLVKGDRAAKKSASREIQCIKTFHRMENSGFHTLATVLVDYLGSRFICQSILPGILQGEKSHTILLGSVDVEIPMKCDPEFQDLLKEKIAEPLNLLSRPVYASPLTEERREECKKLKKASLLVADVEPNGDAEIDKEETMETCSPLETKGIQGSDQRKYLLDFGRMTPRDANWVPQKQGGTGKWEGLTKSKTSGIPNDLEDEEWTMNVLRPELVNQWIRSLVSKYIEQKRKEHAEASAKKRSEKGESVGNGDADKKERETSAEGSHQPEAKEEEEKFKVTEEEQRAVTDNLKLNVNVFLPDVRVVEPEQMKLDEEKAREAASFLWDEVLPRVTRAIRERGLSQVPIDGKTLTELLHRNGVNCRYLGRLASLAHEEEEKDSKIEDDLKNGRLAVFSRRTMPLSWLELLECEMVARAAKHVLDSYFFARGGAAAAQPAQLVASFLSALISEREETAAQTENRVSKRDDSTPDEEDFLGLSAYDVGGGGDALPLPTRSRTEIWQDIELEIARRFRYSLKLFNKGNKSGRAIHVPLLRRVCQRTGIRLAAKNYDIGAACYTDGNTSGARLTASYPISPIDIVDIVPLMKHSAAYYEGFSPCSLSPTLVTPPLQISLYDAKMALERAHLQMTGRGLSRALELTQEAATLYQRVTENGAHPGVVECIELMANIFLEANDPALATANGAKALGLAVQSGGFDGPNVFQAHVMMFQMLFSAREFDQCVKHLRAAMYILEISGGPRHAEHYDALHKLGAVYSHDEYKGKYSADAVSIFRELEGLNPNDRLLEGFTLRALAKNLALNGEYRDAVDVEKKANKALSRFIAKDHAAMKESDSDLKTYTELAVKQGNRSVVKKTKKEQEELAEAMAADLMAAEEKQQQIEEEAKKKKLNKKKKGKK